MRFLTATALVFFSITPASAQVEPPTSSTLEIDVLCVVAATNSIEVTLAVAEDFDDAVQGVRIERVTLVDCGDPMPVAERRFGVLQTGVHTFSFDDADAVSGVAHRYRVVGLDADGADLENWASSFELVSPIDYATCGDAVIGIGRVTSEIAPALFEPCAGSCWDLLSISIDPLDPIVDAGTVVEITGTIDCALGNVEGCTIVPQTIEASQCGPVKRAVASWGAVKGRF